MLLEALLMQFYLVNLVKTTGRKHTAAEASAIMFSFQKKYLVFFLLSIYLGKPPPPFSSFIYRTQFSGRKKMYLQRHSTPKALIRFKKCLTLVLWETYYEDLIL